MYCLQDWEYRIYCDICNKSYLYKNDHVHIKAQSHINNIRREQITLKTCNTNSKLLKCRYKWNQISVKNYIFKFEKWK